MMLGRSQLPGRLHPAYDDLLCGLLAGEEVIGLDMAPETLHRDETGRLYQILTDEQPLVLVRRGMRYAAPKREKGLLLLKPDYLDSVPNMERMRLDMKAKAASIAKGLSGPPVQRALGIHKWLVENVTYDEQSPTAYTAVGALLEGRAVCSGISLAFVLIARYAGIGATVVTGNANSPDNDQLNHAWNLVDLGGGLLGHVDSTYEMGLLHPAQGFFMLPTSAMRLERWFPPAPLCLGLRENRVRRAATEDDLIRLLQGMRTGELMRIQTGFSMGEDEQRAEFAMYDAAAACAPEGAEELTVRLLNYERNAYLVGYE